MRALRGATIPGSGSFTAMREPDALDLGADLLGALAGVLLASLLARTARRLAVVRRAVP